mgnify:CR=1 FL=1
MAEYCISSCRLFDNAGLLAQNISRQWLLGLWRRNPAMLGMVRDRDADPWPELLLWSGEFSGKYITGAYYIYRLTGDDALKVDVLTFLHRFLELTEPECYFGVVPKHLRLTGSGQDAPELSGMIWDAWSCYHMIEGLLLWHEATGEARLLDAAVAAVDLIYRHFYEEKRSLLTMGSPEMNLSVYHSIAKLYRITGKSRYLRFAKQLERDIVSETPKNWMSAQRKKLEFYQCDTPRWERLHTIMGAAEMYKATGEDHYLQTLRYIINSIIKTDIHNTGAFSTDEWARNGSFVNGNIETCCVIAFNALCCDYLDICSEEEQGTLLDHLEQAYYNAVLGYNSPSGRWCTYSTPMDGVRNASTKENGFQIRPGSPELNCCSANAPRGVGELWRWMLRAKGDQLYLNYFGDCALELTDGGKIRIEGDYPCKDQIAIHIIPGDQFRRLSLRIPGWSAQTLITDSLGTQAVHGSFAQIEMREQTVTVQFQFTPRYLRGQGQCAGKFSVYRGPVLFGMRVPSNRVMPRIPAAHISQAQVVQQDTGISLLLPGGIRLRDFYHLGQDGREYKTWLDIFGI